MGIGIIDSSERAKNDLMRVENKIIYWNNGNYKNGENLFKEAGKKFKVGDIVTVHIILEKCKIEWIV